MVNSKSYLSTIAVDRIIELSWQPVNWILVKPGGGGASEHKLEGVQHWQHMPKMRNVPFSRSTQTLCALTGDILFAKGDFIKHKAKENESEIPCFSPALMMSYNSSPVKRWMRVVKPAFIAFCISPSRHKHHIGTQLDVTKVTFLLSSS